MNKQFSLTALNDELAQVRTKKKEFLSQIERIIPWSEWLELIKPCYYKGERGNKPYRLELMLRLYLLQNLYNLSDEAAVTEAIDSRAFSEFCGVDSSNQVPDGDTLGRFRNLLIKNRMQEKLFGQAVELLQQKGLILKKGTIVDSTLIEAPSSTKNREKQRDPDAHQTTSTVRISRERKEIIAKYATAAVFLYGVISVDEYVGVFNHYEEVHTTSEEALLALKRLAKTDDVEYSISGDIISGPEFQPDFDDYEENVKAIRASQKSKPRYLPDKEEFSRYVDGTYREPEKPYSDLKAHILKNTLTTRSEGLDGVDGDLIDLHEMIQCGVGSTDEFDYFTKRGYKFKGIDGANEFARLMMNAHNNTRMYDNNGFTPSEIFEKFERPKLIPLPKEPLKIETTPKIGRNDPCPCGSGMKYKKCCGKIE